jgi:hypothetical protein
MVQPATGRCQEREEWDEMKTEELLEGRDLKLHALIIVHRKRNTLFFIQQNLNILNSLCYTPPVAIYTWAVTTDSVERN